MGFFDTIGKIGGVIGSLGNPLGLAATGIGLAGGLLFGGDNAQQTTTTDLSPEQKALLERLMKMAEQGVISPEALQRIMASTRERIGAESSGLRQAALQRLTRSGAPAGVVEQSMGDITTRGLRELGGTLADIEFKNEESKVSPLFAATRLLSGTGTRTTEQQQPSGFGFGQLFGSGLQSLLNPAPALKKKNNIQTFNV